MTLCLIVRRHAYKSCSAEVTLEHVGVHILELRSIKYELAQCEISEAIAWQIWKLPICQDVPGCCAPSLSNVFWPRGTQ